MDGIENFFHKFLKIDKENNNKIDIILDIIKKNTKISLKKEDINLVGDKIKIKSNPVVKNEIIINKNSIETDLLSNKIFLKIF